jgi:hypothetical protein
MPKTFVAFASLLLLGPLSFAAAGAERARDDPERKIGLRPDQAVVIPVAIVEGGVVLGIPRGPKPGAPPEDGEIEVEVVKHGLSPYAELSATEKTEQPVDFVAAGLIGNIKIDEVVVCGRLDTPIKTRIASGAWRISLNRFTVHKEGRDCR